MEEEVASAMQVEPDPDPDRVVITVKVKCVDGLQAAVMEDLSGTTGVNSHASATFSILIVQLEKLEDKEYTDGVWRNVLKLKVLKMNFPFAVHNRQPLDL